MRTLVRAGFGALAVGSALIVLQHVVGPGRSISPISRTISEYGLTSLAWVFNIAVLAVAAGSVAILVSVAISRTRRPPSGGAGGGAGLLLGALWVLGLVTLVAFPKANWALGPSVSGQIHRMASLVAFLALPFAVLVLLRHATRRDRSGSALARAGVVLALVALAWFVPIVVAIITRANGGAWWLAVPLGLLERGMAVTEIAALALLGRWAERTGRVAQPSPAPVHPAAPEPTAAVAVAAAMPAQTPAATALGGVLAADPVTDPAAP